MKQTALLAILLLLARLPLRAQTDQTELRQTFSEYFELIRNPSNPACLDYIYPKLFEHYPRPLLEAAIGGLDDDTSVVISLHDAEVTQIADELELNGIRYTRMDYRYRMHLVIYEESDVDEEDEEDLGFSTSLADLTYSILKGQYGEKNTTYDPKTGTIEARVDNQLYAILDPAYEGWKFLEKKESMKEVLELLIPEKVLKKLK